MTAKKADGNDYVKVSEKDISDMVLMAQDVFA